MSAHKLELDEKDAASLRSATSRSASCSSSMVSPSSADNHELEIVMQALAEYHAQQEREQNPARKLCSKMAREVGDNALKRANRFIANSHLYDPERENKVRKLNRDELLLGRLLGKGCFSHVYEVSVVGEDESWYSCMENEHDAESSVKRCQSEDETVDTLMDVIVEEKEDSGSVEIQLSCDELSVLRPECPTIDTASNNTRPRYAVKFLRPSIMGDHDKFRIGAADLVLEAMLLSNLDHPNIIKLHGVTGGCVSEAFSSGLECSYFLVLDRLNGTLDQRMKAWVKDGKHSRSVFSSARKGMDHTSSKRRMMATERLRIAHGVAQGLEYLHKHNVVFRDLKPHNIGFDIHENVKIFDFGLATEINPDKANRRLTGLTGSLRYMAPEVAKCVHYGLPVDIYSFGIMLWELYSLEKPFRGLTRRQHADTVVYGGLRPKLDSSWSPMLRSLMSRCWDAEPHSRPNPTQVLDILTVVIETANLESISEGSRGKHGFRRMLSGAGGKEGGKKLKSRGGSARAA